MPNIKSAKKRLRQSEDRRVQNQAVSTRVRTYRKTFMEAVAGGDKETSETAYKRYCSVLDKAVKSGRIKKNTAVRRKARAADKVRALS